MKETESHFEPEPQQIKTAEELRTYLIWKDEQEGIENGRTINKSVAEKALRGIALREDNVYFCIKNQNGEFISGARVAKTRGFGFTEPIAMIGGAYISPRERNKGMVKKLTDRREVWARENGIEHAITVILNENVPSLVSKLHQGYKITDVSSPDGKTGSITLHKNLMQDEETHYSEKKVVNFADLYAIKDALVEGWIGAEIIQEKEGIKLKMLK